MTFPTGWTKRSEITVPAAQVGSGGVSSFTALFTQASINAASQTDLFANAKSDGSDLRVSTDSAGSNLLTVDVIEYDAVGETFVIRVGTLVLSATVANTLYLWWGNSAATAQTGSGAYDADWVGYWPAANETDRTAFSNTLTRHGTPTDESNTGPFGSAATNFGTIGGNRFETLTPGGPLIGLPSTYQWSLFLWSEAADVPVTNDQTAMSWGQDDDVIFIPNDGAPGPGGMRLFWRGMSGNVLGHSTTNLAGAWHHSAVTHSGSDQDPVGYLDSNTISNQYAGKTSGTAGPFSTFELGAWQSGNQYFDGRLAEAHVHSVPRPAAWITTEYNQTNAPASFASSGDPVAVGGAPGVRRRSRWV